MALDKDMIIIPGKDIALKVTLKAWNAIAEYVLLHPMQPGDTFTITTTEGRKLTFYLQ